MLHVHNHGAHGFGTRIGGTSPAPFDTMNLGIAQAPGEPDTEERIAENGRRLLAAVGATGAVLVRIRQVHGRDVVAAGAVAPGGAPTCEGDALVVREPGVASTGAAHLDWRRARLEANEARVRHLTGFETGFSKVAALET
jgi:copper oxidase (laccase) domain-containing protein